MLETSSVDWNILHVFPQTLEMVPCNSKPVSILALQTTRTEVYASVLAISEITARLMTTTTAQVEFHVAKKTWLDPKNIGIVKIVIKRTKSR